MSLRARKTIGVLAIMVISCASLLGVGCGSSDDRSERAVEWMVERPFGPKQVRLSAVIEICNPDLPLLEEPMIEYTGNRVYIELRQTPQELEEGQNGCFLELLVAHKKVILKRDLDELVLFDASTDPPEQRWPKK